MAQKQKRPSPLDEPPTASSSDSEEDQQPSSQQHEEEEEEEEDNASSEESLSEEDDEEEEEEQHKPSNPLPPPSKTPPPPTSNSHPKPSSSESGTGSDSGSDSDLEGVVEFTSKTGMDPYKPANGFYDFVKKSLLMNEDVVKRVLDLMGESKRAELEGRWMELQFAEIELIAKKSQLVRDQATMIAEALKSSNH